MLDRDGFKRKTYDELLTDMSAKAKEGFGADANVSERAFLGILLRIMAWFLSLAWMAIEQVYHGAYRKSAEGVQLDKLLPFAGITRNLEEYAYGQVTLTGTPLHTIDSGFLVGRMNSEITYETIGSITLDSNGMGTVDIVCTEIGSVGNAPIGTITEIINPDANITSVINAEKVEGGREKETDAEARARANITVEGIGNTTVNSIRSELLKLPNVRAARVIENTSMETDTFGTPAKSVQSFVLGGIDEEIGQTILDTKAGGIQAYGTTLVTIKDISGEEQFIGFTRATEINLFARVIASVDGNFTENGVMEIKNALVDYIGGVKSDASLINGLNMGERVTHAKALSHFFKVVGVVDAELEFSVDGEIYIPENIDIALNEVAQIDFANIEVTTNVYG